MAEVIRTCLVDPDAPDWSNEVRVTIAAKDPAKPRPNRVYLVVAGSLATRETQAIDQDPTVRTVGRDTWSIEVDVQIPSQRDVEAACEEDIRVSELSMEGPRSIVTNVEQALLTRWENHPAFHTGADRFPDRKNPEIKRLDDLRKWVACHRSDSNLQSRLLSER